MSPKSAALRRQRNRTIRPPDRNSFFKNGKTQRLDVVSPEHSLTLQGQRRDRVGNGIDQKLSPSQRHKFSATQNSHGAAIEQIGKRMAVWIVLNGKLICASATEAHAIRGEALAIIVHNGGYDGSRTHKGS